MSEFKLPALPQSDGVPIGLLTAEDARYYGFSCAWEALSFASNLARLTYEGSTPMSDGDSGMDFHGDNSADRIEELMQEISGQYERAELADPPKEPK